MPASRAGERREGREVDCRLAKKKGRRADRGRKGGGKLFNKVGAESF